MLLDLLPLEQSAAVPGDAIANLALGLAREAAAHGSRTSPRYQPAPLTLTTRSALRLRLRVRVGNSPPQVITVGQLHIPAVSTVTEHFTNLDNDLALLLLLGVL